ncbi:helix-turn-helix domain-containing protein [Vagococcus intermedius]|uniref:XRE family transcriptional regulator n=1 Tax=Vagococcus intermedius TaxID=2991418 RepID=A0AAF0CV39_9ENTE|nr:XRE family transcriptional regulator [Vagococcus intermedius]WEG73414.1 XRE family transcriptional regulator [Vagococcus intermedius]WEG75497.1 XRE family transcriptional regulator [Vagococcus intermedius]
MDIGNKIKNLRIQKNLTQEELGERTDLTKGYISQLERNLSSPSMDSFFNLLEVLGTTPKEFFNEEAVDQKVVYDESERTLYYDEDKKYQVEWLVPESNENDMEPIFLSLEEKGEFKEFGPSLSDTFAYVLEGEVCIEIGLRRYFAKKGETIYYRATDTHQIKNQYNDKSKLLLVATESYL